MDVRLPDGTIVRGVPDGTSKAELTAKLVANGYDSAKLNVGTPPSSVENQSFLENTVDGLKHGAISFGMGVKQRLDDGAAYLENKFGGQSINAALGMKNAADIQKETQTAVDQRRVIDGPLMKTAGGKIGSFISSTVPAVAASFIPGMQSLAGSALFGSAAGLVEPTATGESVLGNAAFGAAGGAAGYGIAKGVGSLLSKPAGQIVSPLDAVATAGREAGYVIPPSQTNNTLMNNILEGLSGKLQMRQQAALKNQPVTNSLAARALGLPEDAPITMDALSALRKQAGSAYEKVKQVGAFGVDETYDDALSQIAKKYTNAAHDFPSLVRDDIPKIVESFKPTGKTFDSGSAIDAIGVAREMADAAYASGNKALGGVCKSSAKALEDLVDRNLSVYESQFPGGGFDSLLGNFRDARQLIAKTYSVQKGLNTATGDINAAALGAQLKKGVPLSGELDQIAQFNRAFPHATKEINTSMPGVSPLDLAVGVTGSLASGTPIPMMLGPARMGVRAAMLSGPYQRAFGSPTSGISGAINAASEKVGDAATMLAPIVGNAGANTALRMRGPSIGAGSAVRIPGPGSQITQGLRDTSDIDATLETFGIAAPPGLR